MYDIIIPVYKPGKEFFMLLKALSAQSQKPSNLILVESVDPGRESSLFGLSAPEGIGLTKIEISSEDFDHAGSRNYGISFSKEPYFVCMTQDAVPAGPGVMEKLLRPLSNGEASMSYARQIPKKTAGIRERMTRQFNYPGESRLKSAADIEALGIKTWFASNACAAYVREEFDTLGGFSAPAVFNEDMVFAHAVVRSGGSIAYVAEARVIHSHEYTHGEDFKRSFDLGASQAMHPEVFSQVSSESEGVAYVKKLCKNLTEAGRAEEIPPAVSHSAVRFLGYRLGKAYKIVPESLRHKFSMNKKFWNN